MVFQDPMQALNPALRIGEQLTEVLTFHQNISVDEARDRSVDMLKRVYMPDPERIMYRFPHQISGGQQQRIVIAMAMLNKPGAADHGRAHDSVGCYRGSRGAGPAGRTQAGIPYRQYFHYPQPWRCCQGKRQTVCHVRGTACRAGADPGYFQQTEPSLHKGTDRSGAAIGGKQGRIPSKAHTRSSTGTCGQASKCLCICTPLRLCDR